MTYVGLHIDTLPFKLKEFEATLLFHEYPTTIIYEDIDGDPIIKEWIDISDDFKTNYFFYYKINKGLLKQFIDGKLPHNELIKRAIDGIIYYVDEQMGGKQSYRIASVQWIPNEHKSQVDFYYKKEDGVETAVIIDHFKLNSIYLENLAIDQAKEISNSKHSETLFIHLNKGKGIGFGTANTEVLAKTLLKFDELYKEAALDYILTVNRGDIDLSAKKNEEYLPHTTTEVYGNVAASFAVLIRPTFSDHSIFGGSYNESISTSVFSLIKNSSSVDELKEEYKLHSDFTIKAFKGFVDEIYKQELDINISWFSPYSENQLSNKIDYLTANIIQNNLDNLTIESEDKFVVKGKFRSINCDTGHFGFISTGGEKYSGYLDLLIKDSSEKINFINIYEITLSRKVKKEVGTSLSKITDTIIAYTDEG